MTKFIYIADTHLGANPMGYQQEKGYPEKLPEIVSALGQFSMENGVDFILHGGDMIDSTTDENLIDASKLFKLPVPVYLCLGNHDLTRPDSIRKWLELAPAFFRGNGPDYSLETEDCVIHVVPNHWSDDPYYWENEQRANFADDQVEMLEQNLKLKADLPHFILTHSPVYGLPTGQTGFDEPFHSPNESFTDFIADFVSKHENIKCVLGAHNHMNMNIQVKGINYVTATALVEAPFEMKLFEITGNSISMSTVSLANYLDFAKNYVNSKPYTHGRDADRSFRS